MAHTIKVIARVRPLEKAEDESVIEVYDRKVYVQNTASGFEYNAALGPTASQADVFKATGGSQLAQAVVAGRNSTVLAYGQTGSGKTHTISGTDTAPGLAPRLCEDVFSVIEASKQGPQKLEVKVTVTYLEVYNEVVSDLLVEPGDCVKRSGLAVRSNRAGDVKIEGLEEMCVTCAADAIACFQVGNTNRQSAYTAANATSSRSHSLFEVKVESRRRGDARTTVGRLLIVDLAGAECADRTGFALDNTVRRQESRSINVSLLSLGRVIFALSDKSNNSGYVPYRESTLTRLLQDSIGGSASTVLIACVSPSKHTRDECISTLRYADRAQTIDNANNKVHVAPPRPPDAETLARAENEADEAKRRALAAENRIQEFALEAQATALAQSALSQATIDLNSERAAANLETANIALDREQADRAASLARVVDQAALQFERVHIEHKITTERLEHRITDGNVRIKGLDAALADARQARDQTELCIDRHMAELAIARVHLSSVRIDKDRYGFALADADARLNAAMSSNSDLLASKSEMCNELSKARDQISTQDITIAELYTTNNNLKGQHAHALKEAADLKSENNDVQTLLAEARTQVIAQESTIAELRALKIDLDSQLTSVCEEVSELKAELIEAREEAKTHESKVNDLSTTNADLGAQLASARQQLLEAASQLTELRAQLSNQESAVAELRTRNTDLDISYTTARQQVAGLTSQVSDALEKAESQRCALTKLRSSNGELDSQLLFARQELAAVTTQMTDARTQVAAQASALAELRCLKDDVDTQLVSARQEAAEASTQLVDARKQLGSQESTVVELDAANTELNRQLTISSEELADARTQLTIAGKQVGDQASTLADLRAANADLNSQLAISREELAESMSQLKEAHEQSGCRDAALTELRDINSNLGDELASAREDVAEAQKQLDKASNQAVNQESTLVELRATNIKLMDQLASAREELSEMTSQRAEAREEVGHQESTIAELRTINADLEKRFIEINSQESTVDQVEEVRSKLTEAQEQVKAQESKIEDLRAANDLFESQILSLTTRQCELQTELANASKEMSQPAASTRMQPEDKTDKDTEKLVADLLAENQTKSKQLAAAHEQIQDLNKSLEKSEASRKATLRANLNESQDELVAGEATVLCTRNTNVDGAPTPKSKYALRPRRNARRAATAK